MEKPELSAVRNACADLVRNENEEYLNEDAEEMDASDHAHGHSGVSMVSPKSRKIPQVWCSKREKQMANRRERQLQLIDRSHGDGSSTVIKFGNLDASQPQQRVRLKVCGKLIHNYPSEGVLNRGGWLHSGILAKDSDLFDAVSLCKTWEEFYELQVLASFHYFPASNWLFRSGDQENVQLLQLGLIPYFKCDVGE